MLESSTDEAAASIDWEKVHPVLNETLGELNDDDRDAVWLRFFEGRSFAQVGERLRLNENAARMRVERALDKLHAALARRGVTSTAAALGLALPNQAAATAPAGLAAGVTGAALAGAGGVGVATGILTFMSTTKVVSGVAAAVALLAIFSAVRESQSADNSVAALKAVTAQRDELQGRVQVLEKRARESGDVADSAQRELAALRVVAATPGENAAARAAAWQTTSPVNFALDHPEARAAFVAQEMARARAKFDRFFRQAGLSAGEQDRFLDVLKNFAEAKLDLTASVRAQGYGPYNVPQDPEALRALFKVDSEVDGEFMGNLRTLLGDERFRQFTAYRKSIPEINAADQLAGLLYAGDTPLTPAQARQLVQVLQENRFDKRATPSPTNMFNGAFIPDSANQAAMVQSNLMFGDIMMPGIDWRAPVTDAAVARAASILAPAQISALRQMQAQQAAQMLLAPPPPRQADASASRTKPAGGG